MMQLTFSEKTDVGLVRAANEDFMGSAAPEDIHGNGHLFVVCDGMGGHVGGATAAQMATASIIEYFGRQFHENPYVAISEAIQFANGQIYARAQMETELQGMGTTCTVVLIRENDTYLGHVGDSRIYLTSNDRLHRITKDHSFVQNLVDQGIITDAESETHARKNELTQALGIKASVSPTVPGTPVQLKTGDKVMLCSDGLCGLVNDPTMQEVLAGNDSLDQKALYLIELAKNAGGTDNITVTLVEVLQSPVAHTVFTDLSPRMESTTGGMAETGFATSTTGYALNAPHPLAQTLSPEPVPFDDTPARGFRWWMWALIGVVLITGVWVLASIEEDPEAPANNTGSLLQDDTPSEEVGSVGYLEAFAKDGDRIDVVYQELVNTIKQEHSSVCEDCFEIYYQGDKWLPFNPAEKKNFEMIHLDDTLRYDLACADDKCGIKPLPGSAENGSAHHEAGDPGTDLEVAPTGSGSGPTEDDPVRPDGAPTLRNGDPAPTDSPATNSPEQPTADPGGDGGNTPDNTAPSNNPPADDDATDEDGEKSEERNPGTTDGGTNGNG